MGSIRRLWNRNFTILWQGQLISDFGNAAFSVALGFWVLDATKSSTYPLGNIALMGVILACFAIPGVLLGPFAGAIADRHNRKWIIVAADFLRGVLFAAMGALVLFKAFPFWCIYPLAILSGACGAFFWPALSSAIPDIVPRDDLTKANSARSLASTTTQLVGNALGGVLYALLTAPYLILLNGISFLYASATQLFIKIPPIKVSGPRKHIVHDMLDGIKYTFGHRGIRALILINMAIGFFSTIILTLLTPLFKSTPGFGVERFGYVMGSMMIGTIIGMLAFSMVKVKPGQRAGLIGLCQMAVGLAAVPIGIIRDVVWQFPLAFIIGFSNSIIVVLVQTTLQASIPRENRGKVFGILGTFTGALQPLAMASSGIIAAVIGLRLTIIFCCFVILAAALPYLISRHFREFMNTDMPAEDAPNGAADVLVEVNDAVGEDGVVGAGVMSGNE